MFPRLGVRPSHGVDHMYSVGPTLLALDPRCGRPGCDVVLPHPLLTWLAVCPRHGVDHMYSVGPTLLALGPRCGRPGCDVMFPHPRVIWRFEWLYLVVGTFCHWTAFGGSGVMACVPSFVVAGYLLCGLTLLLAAVLLLRVIYSL